METSEKLSTRIKCELIRSGNWWAVEIPLLVIFTQGKNKEDAYSMAKDAVECLFDKADVGIDISDCDDNTFYITSTDEKAFVDFILKQAPTTVEIMNKRRN